MSAFSPPSKQTHKCPPSTKLTVCQDNHGEELTELVDLMLTQPRPLQVKESRWVSKVFVCLDLSDCKPDGEEEWYLCFHSDDSFQSEEFV